MCGCFENTNVFQNTNAATSDRGIIDSTYLCNPTAALSLSAAILESQTSAGDMLARLRLGQRVASFFPEGHLAAAACQGWPECFAAFFHGDDCGIRPCCFHAAPLTGGGPIRAVLGQPAFNLREDGLCVFIHG